MLNENVLRIDQQIRREREKNELGKKEEIEGKRKARG